MRAVVPFLFLLLFSFQSKQSFGQCEVINGGFETWVDMTDTFEAELGDIVITTPIILPEGWFSAFRLIEIVFSDFFEDFLDADTIDIDLFGGLEQYEPGALGTDYAAKLTGDTIVSITDMFQVTSCGERPDALTGYYKYEGDANDSLLATVMLANSFTTETDSAVGFGVFVTVGGSSEYTPFEIPIQYLSEEPVDTAIILFISTNDPTQADSESFFVIDEVSFGGNVPVTDYADYDDHLFSPNPAVSTIQLSSDLDRVDQVEIYDLMGNLVLSPVVEWGGEVDISSLPHGLYVTRVQSGDKNLVQKLIVAR